MDGLRRLRIVRSDGRTVVSDIVTGEIVANITALELYQVFEDSPIFAIVKIIGTAEEVDLEVRAEVIKGSAP